MRRLLSSACAIAMMATATLVAGIGPVAADTQVWTYSGTSGGTQINALGTTISSGLTAASNLSDTVIPNSASSGVAGVHVAGLLDVGAVTTGEQATAFGTGVKITAGSKIAGISLLGGAIKVDAIQSTSYATATGTTTSVALDGGTTTTFLNLSIGGKAYPVNIPANTKITIPGLADIVINESQVDKSLPGKTIRTMGTALHITLLKGQGSAPAGAEIRLNPTQALIVPTGKSDALPVGGFSYGTFAGVWAGDSVSVLAQPTGMLSLPSTGTGGVAYSNTIAGVNIPQVAVVNAVTTTVSADTVPGLADVSTGAQLAKINLLGGLITADAVGVTAAVHHDNGGLPSSDTATAKMTFVNLVVAGRQIPINVAPNTQIYLFGIGQVYINQQLTQHGYSAIVGIRITLSTAEFGLPAGADIQVAVASSYIFGS
ncbi:MAG: hypothetical protein JWR52_3029 [Marmoricola sp.]|nr:hypothetical protein [Marmoricola sp.]